MGGARYGGYRARVGLDSTEYTTTTSPNVGAIVHEFTQKLKCADVHSAYLLLTHG